MKKFLSLLAISMFLVTSVKADDTTPVVVAPAMDSIGEITINYAFELRDRDWHPADDRVAAIGGNVDFTGHIPFVTISIGGQDYTSPTDMNGNFSFLVFSNDREFTATAWSPHQGGGHNPKKATQATIGQR